MTDIEKEAIANLTCLTKKRSNIMQNTTTKKKLAKMSADEMRGCTLVASAIHNRMEKGALTRTSIRNLSRRRDMNYGAILYIPPSGDHYIEFGITQGGSTPMRFYEGKYLQLCFSLPTGKEKEFSNLVETLDDKFFDGELTQKTVYAQLESHLESLGQ